MRRLILAVLAIVFIAAPVAASAQDGARYARVALAQRAVQAMQGEQLAAMAHQMTMAFPPSELEGMSGEERVVFDEVMAEVSVTIMERVLAGTAVIYADIFTQEELEAMVAFYESPMGQSILTKTYAATPQMIELVRSIMPEIMTDMVDRLCDRTGCTAQEREAARREVLGQLGMTAS